MRPEIADAIAVGKRPDPMDSDETIIWEFVTELLETTEVSDAKFQAVADRFGEKGVIDLVGAVGLLQYGLDDPERRPRATAAGRTFTPRAAALTAR